MPELVSDYLLNRLTEWGVKRIYGYPGDGINGIVGALERVDGLEFVQVRHEEMAAFMACAHAKFTGEVGVCLATSGPGAIHLLNGLYDAKLDHQPVVAIVGQQAQTSLGGHYQQEVDLITLFKDVAHEVHLGRIADADHPAVDVDLHAARLPLLGEELGVREARPDHQKRVAALHQIPARLGAEKPDRTGHEREGVG